MIRRREFVQAGVAATALASPLAAMASLPSTLMSATRLAVNSATLPLYKVVYDARHSAARAFGGQAARHGAKVQPVARDVHELWYDDLYHRWRESPTPIAGMTHYNAMFVLSMLAQDSGLRVVYRAHHRIDASGSTSHECFGPRAVLDSQQPLQGDESEWTCAAATNIVQWPTAALTVSRTLSNIADANRRLLEGEALVSWIIAAVPRV
jgi:hypothetical protein